MRSTHIIVEEHLGFYLSVCANFFYKVYTI